MHLTKTITLEEAIEQCRQGERTAFKMVYDLFAKPMFNSSMRIVNNMADAEDMVQEAFCDAFRNINSYRNHVPFEGWLRRIVINKSISHLRKKKNYLVDIESVPSLGMAEDEGPNEEIFDYDVQRIKSAIAQLPQLHRMIFNLYVIDELPQEEIAAMVGLSHGNVRTIYHRSKQKILSILKKEACHE